MGVAGQIGEHRRGPGERALGVDDPFARRAAARAIGRMRRGSASAAFSPKNCSRPARWLVRGLRGIGGGTAARARAPAGRSPAGRRPSARRRGRGRRRGRCRAHGDGASAPTPRYAGPASRRSGRRDASGRRRWCAASPRRPRTANPPSCTRSAHATLQPIDTANESLQSIIGRDGETVGAIHFAVSRRLQESVSITRCRLTSPSCGGG